MTLRGRVEAVLSWCPRFNSVRVQLTPFDSLPPLGRGAVSAFLIGLAAWTIAQGLYTLRWYTNGMLPSLDNPYAMPRYVASLCEVTSGTLIIAALIDYLRSSQLLHRHRLELTTILILQVPILVLNQGLSSVVGLLGFTSQPYSDNILPLMEVIIQSCLYIYIATRVRSESSIITRTSLLLLSSLFLIFPLDTVVTVWNYGRSALGLNTYSAVVLAQAVLYGSISFFAFMRSRRVGELKHAVVIPSYIRVFAFFYALIGIAHISNSIGHGGVFDYVLVSSYVLFMLGLVVASLVPLRFAVGTSMVNSSSQIGAS